jgi:tetratricopeptide (TPR) repeat protein
MTDLERETTDREELWHAHKEAGEAALRHGRLAEAEEHYLDALREAERFGPEDPRLAETLTTLGMLYSQTSLHPQRGIDAESLLQRALALREQMLGPEHPEVARIVANLAMLYFRSGFQDKEAELAQAALLFQRALAIQEQAPEPDFSLLGLLNNTRLRRCSGAAEPAITVHGSYTDAAETRQAF